MALTFTERVRADIGGKSFKAFEVTLDGTVTSMTASDFGLNYIEAINASYRVIASADAAMLPVLLTQEAGVSKVEIASAGNAADGMNIWVIGW